jgi:hypothetical protein
VGSPAPIGPDGQAGVTATANGVVGAFTVTARASGAASGVDFSLSNVVPDPSLTLASTAGAGTVGQSQTITATLKDGNGTPLPGIPVTFQVTAGPNAGASGTTSPANDRTDTNGQVAFTYVGSRAGTDTIVATATIPSVATPVSSTAMVTWTAAPPTVVSLHRFGFHLQPTTLVLAFSEPMDAARAEDLGNYTPVALGHGRGQVIPLKAARYDASTRAVTLFPVPLLSLHRTYRIIVNGAPPSGLTSAAGVPLDGRGNVEPGTDFVARFDRRALVLPTTGNGPGADVPRHGTPLLTPQDRARLAALKTHAFGVAGSR